MTVVPFKKEHLMHLLKEGFLDHKIQPYFLPEYGERIENDGKSFTILDEGVPVVFGGTTVYWKNRAELWLVFGKPKTEKFILIYKILVKWLESFKKEYARLEMTVDFESEVQHRWAKILGFKQEAYRLRKYLPHGGDAALYSWVRE
jgi:hypothetical protein